MLLPALLAAALSVPVPCDHRPRVIQAAPLVYPDPTVNVPPTTVDVEVSIGSDGKLTEDHVLQSSGYEVFDGAALTSAEGSTYAPGMDAGCRPAPSRAIFVAEFNPRYGARSPEPFRAPAFMPPAGWQSTQSLRFANASALGRALKTWARGSDRLGVFEFVELSPRDLTDAFGLMKNALAPGGQLVTEKTGPVTVCGGKTSAMEADVHEGESKAMMYVVQNGDALYTVIYAVPQGAQFDRATLDAIGALCPGAAGP